MKKKFFFLLLALFQLMPAQAVLKEKNLEETLCVLLSELEQYSAVQFSNTEAFKDQFHLVEAQMKQAMQQADQTSMMLYSQQHGYIFDLTYACHEATELYRTYKNTLQPYTRYMDRMNSEIARYDRLINSLNKMPDYLLDEHHLGDRDSCILLANKIRSQMIVNRTKLTELQERHDRVEKRLKELNDYAKERYAIIQQNIFVNGGDKYPVILKRFSSSYRLAINAMRTKFNPSHESDSDWRGSIIMFCFIFVFVWMTISAGISNLIIRLAVPKRFQDEKYRERKPALILTSTILFFAIAVMILRSIYSTHGFFQIATELLIQYAWLLGVILISLLIRLWDNPDRIKRAMRIYQPIFVLGFIVIAFRIIFIPNDTVNLVFPPILILCVIWQWISIYLHNDKGEGKISKWDTIYAYISLAVIIICALCSWNGYTLMAVQILIWWYMQLSVIQSITCVYTLLHIYQAWRLKKYIKRFEDKEDKKVDHRSIIKVKDAKGNETYKLDISKTWFYEFIYKALIPIFAVYSVIFSIYWAANVFDLSDLVIDIVRMNLVDIQGTIRLSLASLTIILSMFFLVKYALFLGRELYLRQHRLKSGDKNVMALGMNIVTIMVWGFYLIIVLKILHVDNTGIIAVLAGMSTGIGLALKDLIENLFYGISLMTGRVKVGDIVELDGVRGKVSNINYQSTMVETIDGSIIAFQNSQLFTKNFKNLTKNHGNELVKIPIGVAYGTNVEQVRQMLYANLGKLDCWNQKRGLQILFDNFGDNSVDLILVCWVAVEKKLTAVSQMKEVVYKTFNENGIEIPFPQRDIYVRQLPQNN